MGVLDFGGIQLHALYSEYSTVEGNLRLRDLTLQDVKVYAMLLGCLHQLKEVLVMVLRGTAVDAYIIMYWDNARDMVCFLVHSHLKDVLGHLQTRGHKQEPISAMMGIESGQI